MEYLYSISSWLLNAWLYVLMFGTLYTIISLCCMLLLFAFVLRMRIVSAVFVAVSSSLWAPCVLGIMVVNLGMCIQIPYVQTLQELPNPIVIGLVVSVLYTFLQLLFFGIISIWARYSVWRLTFAAAISNSIAAACVALFYTL